MILTRQSTGTASLPPARLYWDGPVPEPQFRMAEDLAGIWARERCTAKGKIYAMYRDLAQSPADRWWLKNSGLRYDITVIPPAVICGELVKTKGHFHPQNEAGHGYPEIYTVLAGHAHYLIQREDRTDAALIDARAGDVVVVPPGYGHVTINPSADETLHMANIVSARFASNYTQYVGRHGAMYYEMADGSLIKNRSWGRVPPLRMVTARRIRTGKAGLTFPLYDLIRKRSPQLTFLNNPEKVPEIGDLAFP
jgi:glucose-6-phosphate isomerase